MSVSLYKWLRPRLTGWPAWGQWVGIGLLALGFIGLNFRIYSTTYHNFYYVSFIFDQPQAFSSARYIATINTNKAPVLTDTNMTLYYSEADLANSKYAWWGTPVGDGETLAAIQSCKYEYIVFTYTPYPDILNMIKVFGYVPIAPAAWQKGPNCFASS
jgi:hypothetical protein